MTCQSPIPLNLVGSVIQGPKGPKGDKGDKGDRGPAGGEAAKNGLYVFNTLPEAMAALPTLPEQSSVLVGANLTQEGITKQFTASEGSLVQVKYLDPVAYSSGLNVSSSLTTVSKDGVIYAPDPLLVPFTTGAWNAAQWHIIQNTFNSGLVRQFPTLSDAQAAATTLPEGSAIVAEGISQGRAVAGTYQPIAGVPADTLAGYSELRQYAGKNTAVDLTDAGVSGRFLQDKADSSSLDNGGTIIIDASGRRWKRVVGGREVLLSWFEQPTFHDKVNAASQWLASTGGGSVLLNASAYTQTGTVVMLPNVRIRGLGIDKTRIDFTGSGTAFQAAKNGAERHRDSSLSHFLINSTLGKAGGAVAIERGNSTFCETKSVQVANFTVGMKFPMLAGGVLSQSYFNRTEQCWFASCRHAVWMSGASNRNTFDTNTYTDCDVAYNFSEAGNLCETNTFINENVEGCHSWAEWPVGTIYSQTWIGCTIENPSTNGYVCNVRDPGRQVFVNLALIPSRNPSALSFFPIRTKPSSIFGSLASSDALGFNTQVEEELALYGGLRLRSQVGLSVYTGSIAGGNSAVVTVPVTGATVGDIVVASSDKDLLGCVLAPWVSSANTVSVRIQNASGGNVSLSAVTLKAFCVKTNL